MYINIAISTNTLETRVTNYITILLLCRYFTRNIAIISYSSGTTPLPCTAP